MTMRSEPSDGGAHESAWARSVSSGAPGSHPTCRRGQGLLMASPGTRQWEIESWVRGLITEGQAGDRLPTEANLADRFGVSRMTARQAMQRLASENLVERHRGAGSFIAPQPMHRHSGPLMSFTDDMRRRGRVASSRLLTGELRPPTNAEASDLGLGVGERLISLVRLRMADGQPMAIERTVLTPDVASVLSCDLENGSLHQALRDLGREPTTAQCRISARPSSPDEMQLLALPSQGAVLQEQRVIADQDDRPLERTITLYAADRYVIDAVFTLSAAHLVSTSGT